MPRSVATLVENNFINGLITEATALNFPENACTETWNCIHEQTGAITRRKGFEFEEDYTTLTNNRDSKAINTFLWQAATGNGDYNFVVIQIGGSLYFYRQTTTENLSANLKASTINLQSFKVSGAPDITQIECQFSSGNGYLFVVHPYLDPFYVEYDPDADTFEGHSITIEIRDTIGVEDSDPIDFRPTADLNATKYYNLFNQGWGVEKNVTWSGGTDSQVTFFRNYYVYPYSSSANKKYPSNADVWWYMKNSDDAFDPSLANSALRGNTPAPKGHTILQAFYQDRASQNALFAGLAVVSSGYQRPSTTAFFAGRVFYAGVQSQNFSNKIYFSQIIEQKNQFGKCHQLNDPTSETLFDLLPTDGGVINILEAGTIYKLFAVEGALVVFANNGIWTISGSSGIGFAANDYTVKKISTVQTISPSSFVDVGGLPAWWNIDGIYTVQVNSATNSIQVMSMTDKKIKTFYNDEIDDESKRYARGYFDPVNRVVQWIYRDTTPLTVTERYEFNRVLNLNVNTGAFYPWSLTNTTVKINGIVLCQGTGVEITTENVTDQVGATVTCSTGNVTVDVAESSQLSAAIKFLCSYASGGSYSITFAESRDTDYEDWVTHTGGLGYDSYFVSGYKVHGDGIKKVQADYITVYCDNTEATEVNLQSVWDYATNSATGRWSNAQIIAFTGTNYGFKKKRLRLRGAGVSFQLKFYSTSGLPFNVVGWAIWESGNSQP